MGLLVCILVLLMEDIFLILIETLSTEKSVKLVLTTSPHVKSFRKSPYNMINFLLRKNSYHYILHLIHTLYYTDFSRHFMGSVKSFLFGLDSSPRF
jgi:hypothetical protein